MTCTWFCFPLRFCDITKIRNSDTKKCEFSNSSTRPREQRLSLQTREEIQPGRGRLGQRYSCLCTSTPAPYLVVPEGRACLHPLLHKRRQGGGEVTGRGNRSSDRGLENRSRQAVGRLPTFIKRADPVLSKLEDNSDMLQANGVPSPYLSVWSKKSLYREQGSSLAPSTGIPFEKDLLLRSFFRKQGIKAKPQLSLSS